MSFDTATLKDRAHELQAAYDHAVTRDALPDRGGMHLPRKAPDVTDIYDDFLLTPDPASFTSRTDQLRTVMAALAPSGFVDSAPGAAMPDLGLANPHLGAIGTAGTYLADWTGDAAGQFANSYADRFVPTTSNQFAIASMLRYAVNAEAAVWQAARQDLDDLSADALDKMQHVGDCSAADWASALSIVGAVVAAPLTGGASLGTAMGVVGAGLSVAGSGVSAAAGAPGPDEKGLATGSPQEIIESLRGRLGDLKTHIAEQEQKIQAALGHNEMLVLFEWDRVQLPAPALARATPQDVASETYAGHDQG